MRCGLLASSGNSYILFEAGLHLSCVIVLLRWERVLEPRGGGTTSRQKDGDAHEARVHSFVMRSGGCLVERA